MPSIRALLILLSYSCPKKNNHVPHEFGSIVQNCIIFKVLEKETDIYLTVYHDEAMALHEEKFLKPAESVLFFSETETVIKNWDRETLNYFRGLLCLI